MGYRGTAGHWPSGMEIIGSPRITATLLCAGILALTGCAGSALTWEPGDQQKSGYATESKYTVRSGDTLYSISWRNRLDWRDLARWNGLADGGLIYPGQVLRLTPPAKSANTPARTGRPSSTTNPGSSVPSGSKKTPAQASGSSTTTGAKVASWYWPATGPVIAGFGDKDSQGSGLDIGCLLYTSPSPRDRS